MCRTITALALAAGISALGVSAASAMPIDSDVSEAVTNHEQARLVCNEYGRCWRTGPGYRYGYRYAPRYRYGPRYGYFGGPRYYHRRYYGGPGFSFRFGY